MTTSQTEKGSTLRISDEFCCLDGLQKMEPLWSPVVANTGNQSQIGRGRNWRKHAETVAVGCNQLRPGLDGKSLWPWRDAAYGVEMRTILDSGMPYRSPGPSTAPRRGRGPRRPW